MDHRAKREKKHEECFHLKPKVFNNVERPLKAQSSIQAQWLSTVEGEVKGAACTEQEQSLWWVLETFRYISACVLHIDLRAQPLLVKNIHTICI